MCDFLLIACAIATLRCIRGMRIAVYNILEYLAGGVTKAEILQDFCELTSEDIKACLVFPADRENNF
ncbi:DUF433 domain-containing protein [Chrysosporum ovalisporum CS-1034]|uniref:DUF433 domain-containing protein n=1 Tax=Umezakia ovalisporum TaxID=75695 RepID=UPI00247435DA|nr:DUF433 domain-containing protein [Umezakia ovalisporum]MDH6075797.1 DUF433 domain-containing protein [Umezakia ovalisporum CS-1034]